jgi:hypothetical protein
VTERALQQSLANVPPAGCEFCTDGVVYSEQYHTVSHIPEVIAEPCGCPRGEYEYEQWMAKRRKEQT